LGTTENEKKPLAPPHPKGKKVGHLERIMQSSGNMVTLNLFHPNLVTPNVILLDILLPWMWPKFGMSLELLKNKLDQHWMDVNGD
jgi:hypothetical protein